MIPQGLAVIWVSVWRELTHPPMIPRPWRVWVPGYPLTLEGKSLNEMPSQTAANARTRQLAIGAKPQPTQHPRTEPPPTPENPEANGHFRNDHKARMKNKICTNRKKDRETQTHTHKDK